MAMMVLVATLVSEPVKAASDTPFFTGVWELKDNKGVRPLVMSDWLIFSGNLPGTWLYLKQGSIPGQRFEFFARNLNVNGLSAAIVDVAKIDDTHMIYRLSANGEILEQGEATRLSVPNANKSCLAVDTEMKDLLGSWVLASDKKRKFKLSETELDFDGRKQPITMATVRTGQIGLMVSGKPYALFTDAGGDYAVLQVLPAGTEAFTGGPIGQHVNFTQELIVRRPTGRCDAAIAGRLKLLGKKKK
ncbi:hypothetical protein [uncultured Cohaesibacter sp.]|uniref:hypothetical protein n=1 Tax=uncultured Cohaesibacter sp. TaxID=1002546 RepID=UPI0029309574|nr:hypothetical protein [uncultured Cohaesibacter sp.]